jgi:hypothetical protein
MSVLPVLPLLRDLVTEVPTRQCRPAAVFAPQSARH